MFPSMLEGLWSECFFTGWQKCVCLLARRHSAWIVSQFPSVSYRLNEAAGFNISIQGAWNGVGARRYTVYRPTLKQERGTWFKRSWVLT